MQPEFWYERWQRGEIGWHLKEVNAHLEQHWHRLGTPAGAQVLVPLCGKTRDLLWLGAQGYRVLGVELSPIAVEAFFAENGLSPQVSAEGPFRRYQVDEIAILCGDFFHLSAAGVGGVSAVYDRASLIALPPALRGRYAEHLTAIAPAGTEGLLITLEYPQAEMDGPPFSVAEPEVTALFGRAFALSRLDDLDVLAENPRFRERGLSRLREKVYHLRRRFE
jgi:thiopurine S-methyltransferase